MECPIEFLASEEHYWATILNAHNPKYGYNIRPTNPNNRFSINTEIKKKISLALKDRCGRISEQGIESLRNSLKQRIYTDEICLNMSKAKKGKKQTIDSINKRAKSNYKIILQYDLNGNFIKEWESLISVKKALGRSITGISLCLKQKRKKSKNSIWKYKYEKDNIKKII